MSEEKNLPNFLIVGAAKSGTTSLHNYLSQHPQIHMSNPKEPKFLSYMAGVRNYNGPGGEEIFRNIIKSLDTYKKFFCTQKKIKGESSTINLYYAKRVIPVINHYLERNIKILIILRNPVERAYSAYCHLKRDGREHLSFQDALESEGIRKKNNWEFIWQYKEVGLYSEQVKHYINNFSNVKIFLFEDFINNAKQTLKEIFRFLGVDENFIPENIGEKYNVTSIPKINFIHNVVMNSDRVIPMFIRKNLKSLLNERKLFLVKQTIIKANLRRVKMNPKTKQYLINYYKNDFEKLQKLIGRDLSFWLQI